MSKAKQKVDWGCDGFADVASVAEYLHLSTESVYQLVRQQVLRAGRFGGTIRIPRQDVVEYAEKQLQEGI